MTDRIRMTTEQIIGLILALVIMGIGALGSLLPGFPGAALLLLSVAAHKLWFGDTGVHWWIMVLLVLLTVFSMVVEYLATMAGARNLGRADGDELVPSAGHWEGWSLAFSLVALAAWWVLLSARWSGPRCWNVRPPAHGRKLGAQVWERPLGCWPGPSAK